MAAKLNTELPIFLGTTAVRKNSVVDHIRQAVAALDKGEGVAYADLEAHLLAEFTPTKSESYGPSYIKAYVRDGIHRYGHLSHENIGAEYSALETPEKKAAAPAAPKKLNKAQQAEAEYLGFMLNAGQIESAEDLDNTSITIEDVVTGTNRKTKTVQSNVAKLEEKGFLRTEEREGNKEGDKVTYVFLTENGMAHLEALNAQAQAAEAVAAVEGSEGDSAEA